MKSILGVEDSASFYGSVIAQNGGTLPDMEGLIRDVYSSYLKLGDLCLDVGVNHGGHLVQMARAVGPTGKVIGFEAAPELVKRTKRLIADCYPDTIRSIKLYNVAVSDREGTATFYFSKINDSGLSGLAKRAVLDGSEVEEISVPLSTIDRFIESEDIEKLTFVKLDIEGAEYNALRGARTVLKQRPLLAFEWDSQSPTYFEYEPPDFFNMIVSSGYTIHDLFGFEYEEPSEFIESKVWNFIAVPLGIDASSVLLPSLQTLHENLSSDVIPKYVE